MRIWLDVESSPGVRTGPGPVIEIVSFQSTARLNQAGTWTATVPALDMRAVDLLQPKRVAMAFAMVDGVRTLIGGGPIDDMAVSLRGESPSLTVTGLDLLGELAAVSMGSGESYNGEATLRAKLPATWSITETDPVPSWAMRYEHESVLGAMAEAASKAGFYFRLPTARVVEWFTSLRSSGVLATANGDALALERNVNACAITAIEERRGAADLANRLYIYGSGNGDARLTLAAATQWPNGGTLVGGYTDADGNTWTVDKAASAITCTSSVATYGAYDAPLTFTDIAPLSNTTPDMQAAANFLLTAALQQGRQLVKPQYTYSLSVAGLRRAVLPGQTIRVQARRYIDGQRPINIDRDLVVLEVATSVDTAGIRTDSLTVSTLAQWPVTDASVVASTIREVQAAAAHPQMSASLDTISYRESIDDTYSAALPFWLGSEVTTVSQVLVRFRCDPLRSTVKTVGSAATTSGASSASTTLSDNAFHGHSFSLANSTTGNPVFYNSGTHAMGVSGGGTQGVDTTNANHSHGMAHTHDVTPTITTTYGIYEDGSPYAATDLEWIVNGTLVVAGPTSLGSGWYSLDITSYAMDAATFRPVAESNTLTVQIKTANKVGKKVQVTAQVSLRTVIQAVGYSA